MAINNHNIYFYPLCLIFLLLKLLLCVCTPLIPDIPPTPLQWRDRRLAASRLLTNYYNTARITIKASVHILSGRESDQNYSLFHNIHIIIMLKIHVHSYAGTIKTDPLSLNSIDTQAKVNAIMVIHPWATPTIPISLLPAWSAKETLL